MTADAEARRLLAALRRAGCDVFLDVEDHELYCSPPRTLAGLPDDVEVAIEECRDTLAALLRAEGLRVH